MADADVSGFAPLNTCCVKRLVDDSIVWHRGERLHDGGIPLFRSLSCRLDRFEPSNSRKSMASRAPACQAGVVSKGSIC